MSGQASATLQPYLPRLVLEWQQYAPEAVYQVIDGTMVFVDISGFTSMSERLARRGKVGAEEVTEVIGDTFGRLLAEAYAFGGSLIKFGGDALLLFFSGEGHPPRAAAAALGMRAELRRIGTFTTTAGKVTLRMSVGVHTGAFHFFLVGETHKELIVAGTAASQTVLMESAASAGQILLSPDMARALPKKFLGPASGPGVLLRGRLPSIERSDVTMTVLDVDLTPFIPQALRDTVLGGGVEAEHRPVTVAFVHFTGVDALIDSSGPELAAQTVGELVRRVQKAVAGRHVAFLASDIAPDGGKLILTAGAPDVTGNDEEQMLLALREIASIEHPVPIHIGVNRGHVFAGEIGPLYRRTYTVMGDAVNLAARLMARAEPGQILATEEVLAGSRTLFDVAALEPFPVKGKKHPVHAYSVGAAKGSRAQITEATLPLVGRTHELKQMMQALLSAQHGRGRLIDLVGEPGIGKSRLLEEFLGRCRDASVRRTECRLYQSASPYFPFWRLLREALRLDAEDEKAVAAQLQILIETRIPELLPWMPLIAVPVDVKVEDTEEVRMLEDEFRRPRLQEVVRALLSAVVTEPTVMVVEDTHWMDEASRDLLAALSVGLDQRSWLICLTRRPGSGGFDAAEASGAIRLDLEPLGVEQAADLIFAATKDAPLMPQQVHALAQRAGGNPLFLIELLHALQEGGDVESLPHSVEGLIGARIDKLGPADRTLLRHVSVLGAGFHLEHMAGVLPEPRLISPPEAVRRLGDFLLGDSTDWVRFRHALIRDAAYEGLPYRTRQQLHARVGDSIRLAAGDHPEDQAELLSLHYFQARRWSEAWTYSRLAGDAAKKIYANLEAATFYRRAQTSARHADVPSREVAGVAESLGDVLELTGLFDEALDRYRRATHLTGDDPIRRADLLLKRARARARVGAYPAAFRELSIGRRIVTAAGTPEAAKARARLTALGAHLRQRQEHPRAALALAQQAASEAEEAKEPEALARAYLVLDAAYNMLGQRSMAVYGLKALQLYEQMGDLRGVALITNNLGGQAYFEGRWDVALDYYARAQEAFRRVGNEPEAAMAGANIGEVLVSQGRFAEAEPVLTEAVRVLRAHNLVDVALFAETQRARLLLLRGDREKAMDDLSRIRAEAMAVGQTHSAVEAAIYLAWGLVGRGDASAALGFLAEVEQAAKGEAELYACSLARVRASALAALGRRDEAFRQVERGLAQARDQGLVYEEALLLMTQAEVADDGELTNKALQEASRLLQQLGVVQAA